MKIGIVYKNRYKRWPKFQWVHQALVDLGHTVFWCQSLSDLEAVDAQCDLVLFEQRNFGLDPADVIALARQKKAVWVQWWFDLLIGQERDHVFENYRNVLRAMDVVLVKERTMLDRYKTHGIHAIYSDQGCPEQVTPISLGVDCLFDAILFGSKSEAYQDRVQDISALVRARLRVGWIGDGRPMVNGVIHLPWVHPLALGDLISKSHTVLSIDLRHDVDGYWSDRLWLSTGYGTCVLRRNSPGLPSDLPAVTYDNSDELIGLVYAARQDVNIRTQAGAMAIKYTMEHKTVRKMCESWLKNIQPLL